MSRAASSSLRWLSCADSRAEPLDSLYRSARWRPHVANRSPTSFHASFVPDIAILRPIRAPSSLEALDVKEVVPERLG